MKQLAYELRLQGQKTAGKKIELLEQLMNAIIAKVPVSISAYEIANSDSCMNGLATTAYWEELTKNNIPFLEPNNPDKSLLPSTEMDDINQKPNPKYGFK